MRRVASISITSIVSLALLAGCNNREVSKVEPNPVKEQFKDIPVQINRDIDILFVIDNSGSMDLEQASLADNFPRFIEVLENIEGGLPNVHIGVISSDVGAGPYNISNCNRDGDNGALQTSGCASVQGNFIKDIARQDGSRETNYTGTLAQTFSCMAELGIDGCGFEMHLESMYRALNAGNPTNNGFLRPDAFLAVIFLADEDDCSTENTQMFDTSQTSISDPLGPLSSFRCFEFGVKCDPDDSPRQPGPRQNCVPRQDPSDPRNQYMYSVDRYVSFLKQLKPDDPSKVIVAGIVGNPTPVTVGVNPSPDNDNPELVPSCSSANGDAAPAVRLKYFLDQFPQRNSFTSICNENLSDALVLIAELLRKVIGNPCLEGDLDLDPETPGVQYECQVSDVRFPGQANQSESIIPECSEAGGALPCWRLQEDPDNCGDFPSQMSLIVERSGDSVPSGTHVQARCVVK